MANPSGLCKCGCGERTRLAKQGSTAKGYVKGEPIDFVYGHNNRRYHLSEPVQEDRGYVTPCLIWIGNLDANGYGRLRSTVNGERITVLAHRFMYEQAMGPVIDGLHLDHLCEQPSCVRPDHLMPRTPREHRQRHSKKMTPDKVRALRSATGTLQALADEFGISAGLVWDIKHHRKWTNVL